MPALIYTYTHYIAASFIFLYDYKWTEWIMLHMQLLGWILPASCWFWSCQDKFKIWTNRKQLFQLNLVPFICNWILLSMTEQYPFFYFMSDFYCICTPKTSHCKIKCSNKGGLYYVFWIFLKFEIVCFICLMVCKYIFELLSFPLLPFLKPFDSYIKVAKSYKQLTLTDYPIL